MIFTAQRIKILPRAVLVIVIQGRRDGGVYWCLSPPKSTQVNFYGVKMTSERLFNTFIPPKNFYILQNKFLATPLS